MQTIITEENPFALAFKNMAEVEDEELRRAALEGRSVSVVKMSLFEGQDRRRYNLPSHNEVAVVFVGEDGAPPASREVVIYPMMILYRQYFQTTQPSLFFIRKKKMV